MDDWLWYIIGVLVIVLLLVSIRTAIEARKTAEKVGETADTAKSIGELVVIWLREKTRKKTIWEKFTDLF